jgi:hypothetical protein
MNYMSLASSEKQNLRKLKYQDEDGLDCLAESIETKGTVGSELRALTLSGYYQNIDIFLETLVSRGCHNELESLELDHCDVTALSTCVCSFAHLRKLKISIYAHEWHQVVKAVKKNGSLHKVSWVNKPSFGPRKPGHRYRRHLKAACSRNRLTPKLLANPRLDRQHDNHNASATTAVVENFSSLFLASMDAERTAPNMLLIGLVATTPTDCGHGKRLRSLT